MNDSDKQKSEQKSQPKSVQGVQEQKNQHHFAWLGYCRPGFERDLAEEFQSRSKATAIYQTTDGAGYALVPAKPTKPTQLAREGRVADFIFARQVLLTHLTPIQLTSNDRVTPILARLLDFLEELGIDSIDNCWVEYPDTNDGKALSRAAKAIEPRLIEELEALHKFAPDGKYRAHVFLTPAKEAWIGVCDVSAAATQPFGIPRMRMPHDAPSRSTLKLAEALHVFLGDDEANLLQPDMRAVDLGAAPGGWTWQLIHRGVNVTAIDNGPLKGELVDNAMVKHLRMDGFKYTPNVPVDWMVCDMVEQPSRIAKLVATWLANGWARYIIFNLKLPMKKRHEEILRCRQIISDAVDALGKPLALQFKQLYHDREEVTAFVTIPSRRAGYSQTFARNAQRVVGQVAPAKPITKPKAAVVRDVEPAGLPSPWSSRPPREVKKTEKKVLSKKSVKTKRHR